jgi:small conductance mechanosensitive channel
VDNQALRNPCRCAALSDGVKQSVHVLPRFHLEFAVILFIATLLIGPAAPLLAQAPGTGSEPSARPSQSVTVVPTAADGTIAKRLHGILESTGWYIAPRVTVRDGIATLEGTTDSQEHRNWAGQLAKKTQDVVAVVNKIKVESDVGSTFDRAREELANVYRNVHNAWPIAALAVVIFIATWFVAKLVAMLTVRFFGRRISSPLLLSIATKAAAIPVFLLGTYFVLQVAGLTRLAITVLGGTGLAGIIIGFAFRGIAENFLASLLLSVRNPFRSGDLVEIAGNTGIVQNLNTRSTVLLTLDGNHVQIPNATVYQSVIVNFSSNPCRRATFTVGIGYDSSAAKAQELIAKVLRDHPAVLDSPEPSALVDELGAATVNLRVHYWFDSATHSPARINSALLRLTKNALIEGGIELPDPAREVIFPKPIPINLLRDGEHEPERPVCARPASAEETSAATIGEVDLSNETDEVREQSESSAPEASENLLKN